jgi:hypothetical protein
MALIGRFLEPPFAACRDHRAFRGAWAPAEGTWRL